MEYNYLWTIEKSLIQNFRLILKKCFFVTDSSESEMDGYRSIITSITTRMQRVRMFSTDKDMKLFFNILENISKARIRPNLKRNAQNK